MSAAPSTPSEKAWTAVGLLPFFTANWSFPLRIELPQLWMSTNVVLVKLQALPMDEYLALRAARSRLTRGPSGSNSAIAGLALRRTKVIDLCDSSCDYEDDGDWEEGEFCLDHAEVSRKAK